MPARHPVSSLSFPDLFRGVPEKQRIVVVAEFKRAGGVVSAWPGEAMVPIMAAAAFDVENSVESDVAARGRAGWREVEALHRARLRLEAAMGW